MENSSNCILTTFAASQSFTISTYQKGNKDQWMTSPKQSNYFQKMGFGQMGQKTSVSKPFRIPQ